MAARLGPHLVAGLQRAGKRCTVVIEPFGGLPQGSRDELRAEAEDVGRFLGIDVGFEVRA